MNMSISSFFFNILKISCLQKLETPDSEGNTGILLNSTKHLQNNNNKNHNIKSKATN